ncbi:MAG: di-heme oxidoredictase family protein [Marinagarivorans sp.]|nr:di-heme oxidoredictase family protein [Marinagarivorans sp.]
MLALLLCAGCQPSPVSTLNTVPDYFPAEALPGGATSVSTKPFARFDKPVANLAAGAKPHFYAGKALAQQPWIKAPATTDARDGLGPIYNARSCLACHIKGGKGRMPDDEQTQVQHALVRMSITDPAGAKNPRDPKKMLPEPVYGEQLQTQSTALSHQLRGSTFTNPATDDVKPEAYAYVRWHESTMTYPDGQTLNLRRPELILRDLGYGPMHADTQLSLRLAPAILGMGLIELIPQAQIDALADEQDANGDGISGRVNWAWDAARGIRAPGRFSLKANRAFLDTTVAAAFAGDLGISNPVFPQQPCSAAQTRCLSEATGNNAEGFELPADLLELVVNFNRHLAVPKSRYSETNTQGRTLFYQSQCASCHHPRFVTGNSEAFPALANQVIWPYSDFLLHDMGAALADNRPDFDATGQEWRTPPLWGLGLNTEVNGSHNLLHDGRARSVAEAILWHGGEAEAAKNAFMQLSAGQREALVEFVGTL